MAPRIDFVLRSNAGFAWPVQFTDAVEKPYDWSGSTFVLQAATAPGQALVVDLESGRMHSIEFQLWWQHAMMGRGEATEFIPIAEESGISGPLATWTLRAACKQFVEVQKFPTPCHFSDTVPQPSYFDFVLFLVICMQNIPSKILHKNLFL